MSDLISRADAIGAVCRTRCGDKAKGCPAHSCLVIEEFDALLSAEQVTSKLKSVEISTDKGDKSTMSQPNGKLESADAVQGEWLYVENEPYSECSKCGRYIDDLDEDKYAYCPYCGARMTPYKGGDE